MRKDIADAPDYKRIHEQPAFRDAREHPWERAVYDGKSPAEKQKSAICLVGFRSVSQCLRIAAGHDALRKQVRHLSALGFQLLNVRIIRVAFHHFDGLLDLHLG